MIDKNNDFYTTLQVHPEAAQEIIDAAYRCLSKKYHPDINSNTMSTEYMKNINIAYSVVGNAKKRTQYHHDWIKQNKLKQSSTSTGASAVTSSSSVISTQKEMEAIKEAKEQASAYDALDVFFTETVKENWNKAYEKLTKLDMGNVPLADFVEWKKVVTQIYKLGGYKISFLKKYSNCEYAGIVYPIILQFSVSLNEMKVSTSQFAEENTQKYVAFDGGVWRICLGYKDLKPNIMKFKYLAKALPKVEKNIGLSKPMEQTDILTGLFNSVGFIEQANKEVLRSKRYGNPVSLAIIKVEAVEENLYQDEINNGDACVSYVSEVLLDKIRKTDVIGRCGDAYFAILFTETKISNAKKALNNLLKLCEPDDYLNFKLYAACVPFTEYPVENQLEEALAKVLPREKPAKIETVTEDPQEIKMKLGKYKISDILSFNKSGKNHF